MHVQPAADPHLFSMALLEGAEGLGLQRFPNSNGQMMESVEGGCAFTDETVRNGKRQSIFCSYVYPIMDQPNITVLTGALAARIEFTGNRATGIEFLYNGKTHRAQAAREVILSLGAIQTPKLLMQSGIGDEAELSNAGITVLHALPGVGRNLHDHVAFGCVWENAGIPSPKIPRSQTSCFWKTRAELEAPNFYIYSHGGPEFQLNAVEFRGGPSGIEWQYVELHPIGFDREIFDSATFFRALDARRLIAGDSDRIMSGLSKPV